MARLEKLRPALSAGFIVAAGLLLAVVEHPDRGVVFSPVSVATVGDEVESLSYPLVEASQAVSLLLDQYAFQARLVPRRMLLAALQAMEARFDALQVEPFVELTEGKVADAELPEQVAVRYRDRSYPVAMPAGMDLYEVLWRLMELFNLLRPDPTLATEMEEAAISGLLAVLDPHTVYLDEEEYREMRVSTQGSFGGLGIVISVRQGRLLVMSVMAGTPAARAGLTKGDHIVQIDQESTVNLLVSEAAAKMRGKPGSQVALWIVREDDPEPREYRLVREEIKVRSVLARQLDGRTVCLRVKGFQTETAQEVERLLGELYPAAPPTGIILDLRGNSGGVMAAAVELADLFLEEGKVVTTVERVREGSRPEFSATGSRYENSALVVLVDHASASASEIVAAALKYRNRGVVIGNRTFGKGSVQFIRPLNRGALKLTVSQYVGPEMELIQGVGIEPHIALEPVYFSRNFQLPHFADGFEGEGALPFHLEKTGAVPVSDSPEYHVRYLQEQDGSEAEDGYDEVTVDLPVRLAWSMLANRPQSRAATLLANSEELILGLVEEQEEELGRALLSEGKEWADCRPQGPARVGLAATLAPSPVAAGQEAVLRVIATNHGDSPWCRLFAIASSEAGPFDDRTCVLGYLPPGGSSSCDIKVKMAATSPGRRDPIFVTLHQGLDLPLASAQVEAEILASPLPRVGMTYHFRESRGNGDGRLQPDEEFELVAELYNLGEGTLEKGLVTLKNQSGAALFLRQGRADVAGLGPGERQTVTLTGSAAAAPADGHWRFRLALSDLGNRRHFHSTQELRAEPTGKVVLVDELVRARGGQVALRALPDPAAPPFAVMAGDGVLPATARIGDWVRVQLPEQRWGFVPSSELGAGEGEGAATVVSGPALVEPLVRLAPGSAGELIGTQRSLTLRGEVSFGGGAGASEAGVALHCNGRKRQMVYIGEVAAGQPAVPFELTAPLEPGSNHIVISAFQKNQSPGYATLYYSKID